MEDITININQGETDNIINYEPIKIKQNETEYNLNLKSKGEMIIFSMIVKKQLLYYNYIRKISFKEIKELNKIFYDLNSFDEFYNYLKSLSDREKLNIKIYNDKISIIIYLEVLFKQKNVEIDLFIGKQDIDFNMEIISKELLNIKENEINKLNEQLKKEINNLKKKNEELIQEIGTLKKEINDIKKENKKINEELNQEIKKELNKKFNSEIKNKISLFKKNFIENIIIIIISILPIILILSLIISIFYLSKPLLQLIYPMNKSVIMELNEEIFIFSEIRKRMKRPIKGLNKLYQATTDGGEPINFHSKCDYYPNTLVLIKSAKKRRFGGFTPIPWNSEEESVYDKENKTFVFSLDNKKIYNLISYVPAVNHKEKYGPIFG